MEVVVVVVVVMVMVMVVVVCGYREVGEHTGEQNVVGKGAPPGP